MPEAAWVSILLGLVGSIIVTVWQARGIVARIDGLRRDMDDLRRDVERLSEQSADLQRRLVVVEDKLAPFLPRSR